MSSAQRKIRLLAHNIRSLWNVGAFFRTCDALAIERLYLTGYTGHPPRKEISKTALGAEEFVLWEHHKDPIPLIEELQKDDWHLVALEILPHASPLQKIKWKERTCVIVGHELTGIPENILSLCQTVTMIPMLGKKESLNVAVATGIALYSARTALSAQRKL